MSDVVDRLYALEAAQPPQRRHRMGWRMSQDIADLCALEVGIQYWHPGRFALLGYPAVIDAALAPDSLLIEDTTEIVGRIPATDSLDAAWAAALEVAPEGAAIELFGPVGGRYAAQIHGDHWLPGRSAGGDTHVAALRELTAKLKDLSQHS
jgi:hypothetical protein